MAWMDSRVRLSKTRHFWHFHGFGGTFLEVYGHNANNVHRFFHPKNTPKSAKKHGEDALKMVESRQKEGLKSDS
jgi:hypothetical protein